ncbi:PaaI family thioesterase [Pseudomonas lundensis]|uniref:PaaI family thioesterase n=1 Tax=Pseudomonas lundensis TaxID=86185 RepID=UPI001475C14D|nr:PaaI family thioesterase [Pseudomonas lundensis]NNA01105.1 PaaI family thioesterase [Pseudomonas lundensis]
MKATQLSGYEHLLGIAEGAIAPPSIFATMGMLKLELIAGSVKIHCKASEQHCNPMGGVHGGFAATVIDSVTGCAVHSLLEAGVGYGTVDLSVKMMRPVPLGEDLIAEAKVTHLSRAIGIAEATVRRTDGTLLASGSATCYIKRPK